MKHIKAYEAKDEDYVCGRDENLLYINFPSTKFFKSDIKFQLIFVDTISKFKDEDEDVFYKIKSDNSIKFSQYQTGTESFSYIEWEKTYYENEFKEIKFMQPKEFYRIYKSSYIRIFEDILDKLEENKYPSDYTAKIEEIKNRLTIPEVEYLIQTRKYNL